MAWDSEKTNVGPNKGLPAEEWNAHVVHQKGHRHDDTDSRSIVFPTAPDPSPRPGHVYFNPVDKHLYVYVD